MKPVKTGRTSNGFGGERLLLHKEVTHLTFAPLDRDDASRSCRAELRLVPADFCNPLAWLLQRFQVVSLPAHWAVFLDGTLPVVENI
jgi:hypothetical protein